MPEITTVLGFLCGAIAGAAARWGRLCSMGATEDLLISRDGRAAKAWGVALAVAIVLSLGAEGAGWATLEGSLYRSPRLDIAATLIGGVFFGLGMALAGTCGFGLLVRGGGGDLRALITALAVGVVAIAATAGALNGLRLAVTGWLTVEFAAPGGATLPGALALIWPGAGPAVGPPALLLGVFVALLLAIIAWREPRLRQRPRMVSAAALIGCAIALGWVATSGPAADFEALRPESLTFVAPAGRALLQFMVDPLRGIGFGIASVLGVIAGAGLVAILRGEQRLEAFDDPREMVRHFAGAALMGLGGVLARGCTIGQGLSAGSALALSVPLFLVGLLIGARVGLIYLLGEWPQLRHNSASKTL